MASKDIQEAIGQVAAHFESHPEEALSQDSAAKAVLDKELRFRVEGPRGWVIETDMPRGLGGGATAPSPGWLRRAAQAACEATMIAIRAAQQGVDLDRLEVTVTSQSDDRGMLGVGEGVPAGPLNSSARVTISARDASPDKLREIIEWAEQHSPVGDALSRAVPHEVEIEIS